MSAAAALWKLSPYAFHISGIGVDRNVLPCRVKVLQLCMQEREGARETWVGNILWVRSFCFNDCCGFCEQIWLPVNCVPSRRSLHAWLSNPTNGCKSTWLSEYYLHIGGLKWWSEQGSAHKLVTCSACRLIATLRTVMSDLTSRGKEARVRFQNEVVSVWYADVMRYNWLIWIADYATVPNICHGYWLASFETCQGIYSKQANC